MKTEFELGDKAQEQITGIKGTVVSIYYILSGCIRYVVQPLVPKGVTKVEDSIWMDKGKLISKAKEKVDIKPFQFELGESVYDLVSQKRMYVIRLDANIGGYNSYKCRVIKPKTFEELSTALTFEESELESCNKFMRGFGDVKKRITKIKEKVADPKRNFSPMLSNRSGDRKNRV